MIPPHRAPPGAPPRRRVRGLLPALLASAVLPPSASATERLELRQGSPVEAAVAGYEDGVFVLEDGRRFSRDEVRAIDFGVGQGGVGGSAGPGATDAASPGTPTGGAGAPGAPPAAPAPAPDAAKEPAVAEWNRQCAALEARYPGFATTLVRDEASQVLRADGTRLERTRMVYRINKDNAIGYGSWGAGFDPARERVRVIRARTLLPDGTVIPLDPAKQQVRDARSSASNLTNRKQLLWQLDGVQVGAYVEHVYETETFNPFRKDFFFPRFFFQSSTPVAHTSFTVEVPEDQTLHWVGSELDAGGVTHEETRADGVVRHRWQAADVAPMVQEPRMPGSGDLLPRVSASLFDDWDTFFAWERENLKRNLEPGPRVTAKAKEVTHGLTDPEAKVAALYRFLQREIRYVSVKSGIGSGWSGHPAEETLANGYGDCVDKSVLFCAMLSTLGIEAQPITIMTNDVRDMETRLPGFDANHCITQVHLGERSFFLDSTTTDYRYPYFRDDDHGQPATNAVAGKVVRVPLPGPSDNEAVREIELELTPEGDLTCSDQWSGNGTREAQQRSFWKRQKVQDYPKLFQDHYASAAPGARLADFEVRHADDLTRPLTYGATFEADDYAVRAGPLMIVKIPFFEIGFSEASLAERKYPIDYRTTSRSVMRWSIRLPEGFRVKAAPADTRIETKAGVFELTSRTAEDGRLVIDRVLTTARPMVSVEDYAEHRQALKKIEALGKEQLFLEEDA